MDTPQGHNESASKYRYRSLPERTLSALIEASNSINATLESTDVLAAIARSAAVVCQAEAASVLMLDKRRNKLVFRAAVGDRGDILLGEEFDASLGVAGRVVQTGQPMVVSSVVQDRFFFKGIDDKSSFQTRDLIAAPLLYRGEALGVVEVLNKLHGAFESEDLELLQIFANLAAASANNAQKHESVVRENRGFRETLRTHTCITGTSAAMRQVTELVGRVVGSNATVLLLGETGTGKEVTARMVHQLSSRRDKPFIAINCAALPETLLEAELFGHEKGAFTGAVAQKIGRFELADQGTLFLDEIGDISANTQVKLLRVLQEKEFVRVGGIKTLSTDARIIAATNRDLLSAMKSGDFREDLYYRLNVFPIDIPPLRKRREDIPALVDHFGGISAAQLNCPRPHVTDEAMALLTSYQWPGNIRELQNILERAVLLAGGQPITSVHLPREIAGDQSAPPEDKAESSLWGTEKALIIKALKEAGWNQSKASRVLGISRDNLRYRIKKFNIDKPTG